MKTIAWLIGVPLGILLLVGVMGALKPLDEKSRARFAIDTCWADHRRESLAPDQKRMIAGACESMETRFTTHYRVAP